MKVSLNPHPQKTRVGHPQGRGRSGEGNEELTTEDAEFAEGRGSDEFGIGDCGDGEDGADV